MNIKYNIVTFDVTKASDAFASNDALENRALSLGRFFLHTKLTRNYASFTIDDQINFILIRVTIKTNGRIPRATAIC